MDRPTGKTMSQRTKRDGRSGNAILEFAIVVLALIPLCLGVVGIGLAMCNFLKVLQTTRDTAHMFARGIEFDSAGNRDIVVRLASSLHLTRNGGNGKITLSKIITPRQEDCDAANRTNNCPNRDIPVVIHRVTIGDPNLRASRYGTPNPAIVSADGNIAPSVYLGDATVRAPAFTTEMTQAGMTQGRGEIAYVVEGYFRFPALRFLGYAPEGAYCRFVF